MDQNPLEYQSPRSGPMTEQEFGMRRGRNTLLFAGIGLAIGWFAWIVMPVALFFMIVGPIHSLFLTRGRSVCGRAGITLTMLYCTGIGYAVIFARP